MRRVTLAIAMMLVASSAWAQTFSIRQMPIQNKYTVTAASKVTTQDAAGNAWFRSVAGGTGTTQGVLGTIVMRPDWDSGAIKGYDLSGSAGTPGAADYFTYFTATNYHRGDGMHRLSGSYEKVGGAGFFNLAQSAGTPDSDSGWYDANDKSMNYKLDNADIVKIQSTGFTSVLGTNLGSATAADTGCVKSVFNWDAGNRNFIGCDTATGTPNSSDNFLKFAANDYWRGDGTARASSSFGAPMAAYNTYWDATSTGKGFHIDASGNTVFWGNAMPNTASIRDLAASTNPFHRAWIDHVYATDGAFSGSLSYKGVQVTTSVSSCPDVNVTTLAAGHFLRWSGSDWYNVDLVKAYITDFVEADYVHIAGNEVVSGTKTWTATQTMSELQAAAGTGLSIRDSGGTTQMYVGSRPKFPNGVNIAKLYNTEAVPVEWASVDAAGRVTFPYGGSLGSTPIATGLSSCADVDLTTAVAGHTLTYDGSKWYPTPAPASGPLAAAAVTYYLDPTGVPTNDGLTPATPVSDVIDVFKKVPTGFRGTIAIECADGTYKGFGLNDAIRQGSENVSSPEHGEYDVLVYSANLDPTLVTFKGKPAYGPSPPDAVVSVTGSGSLRLYNVGIDCNRQSSEAGFLVGPRARGILDSCIITNVGNMGHGVYVWGGHCRISNTCSITAHSGDPNCGWGILARSDGFVYIDCDLTFTRVARFIELADHARLDWVSGSFTGAGSAVSQSDYGVFMSAGSQFNCYIGVAISEVFCGFNLIDQSHMTLLETVSITNTNEPSPSVGINMSGLSTLRAPTNMFTLTVDNFEVGVQLADGSVIQDDASGTTLAVQNCSVFGVKLLSDSRLVVGTLSYSGNAADFDTASYVSGQHQKEVKIQGLSLTSVGISSDTTVANDVTVVLIDASGSNVDVSFKVIKDKLWKLKATTAPGGNTITLKGESGNIDGAATNTTKLQAQYDGCEVWCDGTDFWLW